VVAWLPSLGGYGESALAATWTPKPPNVSWNDAGALPASAEAAVGVLRQLGVAEGETILILGAGGSVGMIATQLAVRQGLVVIGAVGAQDDARTRELGAIPVRYGSGLLSNVPEVADPVKKQRHSPAKRSQSTAAWSCAEVARSVAAALDS
jgi:NADPH:quinone reductase-like Zn-dependent oxidoreductase